MDFNLDDLVKRVKSAAVEAAFQWAMGHLTVLFPFIQLPIIKQIVEIVLRSQLEKMADKGELGAYMLKNHIEIGKQVVEYDEASKKLDQAPKDMSPEERKRLEDEKIKRARDLIDFGR